MPKIITARHRESEVERARQYIKERLMMPTIPLAMVTLLTGYGSMVFMWFQDTLTPEAFAGGTMLFVVGAVLGMDTCAIRAVSGENIPGIFRSQTQTARSGKRIQTAEARSYRRKSTT
jgi:hypothetical protein